MLYLLPVQSDPSLLLLYPFRFVDPLTGRWVRARYRAERHVIEQAVRSKMGDHWRAGGSARRWGRVQPVAMMA